MLKNFAKCIALSSILMSSVVIKKTKKIFAQLVQLVKLHLLKGSSSFRVH